LLQLTPALRCHLRQWHPLPLLWLPQLPLLLLL